VTHIDTKRRHISSGKHNIFTAFLANGKMSAVHGNVWNRHIRKHLKELIFAPCIEKTQIFASMGTSRNLALYKTKYSRISILWTLPTSKAHRPNLIRFILLFLDHVSVSFPAHHSSDIWENRLMGFLRQECILLRQLGNRRYYLAQILVSSKTFCRNKSLVPTTCKKVAHCRNSGMQLVST